LKPVSMNAPSRSRQAPASTPQPTARSQRRGAV
jgi:hypothetical protein